MSLASNRISQTEHPRPGVAQSANGSWLTYCAPPPVLWGVLSLAPPNCNLTPPLTVAHTPGNPVSLWSTLSSVPLPQPLQGDATTPPPLLQLSQSETHNLALNYTLCSLIILCLLSLARLSSSGSALVLACLALHSLQGPVGQGLFWPLPRA